MRRRTYLTLAGAGLLAGCAGSGDDEGGGATTPERDTATEPDTPPATNGSTPQETQTEASALFVVESFEGPDTVSVGETHQLEITVRNTGDVTGTYQGTLQYTTSQASGWDETEIEIGPIDPGETETLTSDEITPTEAMEVQYRIAGTDAGHTYRVVAPQAGLEVGRTGLIEVDLGYETTPMAEVAATNTGDAITGMASLTVDWFDGNDEYLASIRTYTRGLCPGEAWLARADPGIDVENPDEIASFEVSPGPASPAVYGPNGVTVSNSEYRASEQDVVVRATAKNTRESPIDYLVFAGKVYNDADEVIGHYWTNETDIDAGATVRFEGDPRTRGRNGAVSSHEVLVSTDNL